MIFPRIKLWPSLSPAVYARPPATHLPFPLDEDGCALYAHGRHALWHGMHALGLGQGDEILVPAYHCGREIEALARARLTCRFYDASETLSPDEDELDALLGSRTRALFLIHYFGFAQDAARWRAWCDKRGLLLIEDCAQAWLASLGGRPLGSFGHLAIYSLYKTFPLPDGGALYSTSLPAHRPHRSRSAVVPVAKAHLRWLMDRVGTLDRALSRFERDEREELGLGDPNQQPSAMTRFLLPRLADSRAAERRRANYKRLLDEFPDRVPRPFAEVPDGSSPLIFPVETENDPQLLERLEREGIVARPFWPVLHPLLPAREFPGALGWRRRFVALPVHQELRTGDVERIATALRNATTVGRRGAAPRP